MTIDNVSAGQNIDPDWGNSVADQLNGLPWLTGLTILTGWTQSSQTPANAIEYRRVGDLVTVRGRVTNTSGGALTNTSPCFNLPAGFRPTGACVIQLAVGSNPVSAWHQFAVETGGNLRPASGSSIPNSTVMVFDMGFTFSVL